MLADAGSGHEHRGGLGGHLRPGTPTSAETPARDAVVLDTDVASRPVGVRLRFYERSDLYVVPVEMKNSRTSQVRVSTPEATALDLVSRPQDAGGLFNVATIIGELVQDGPLDAAKLLDLAPQYPLAVVRRLGWLLDRDAEFVDTAELAEPLQHFVRTKSLVGRRAVDLLLASGPRRGRTNSRWGVVENGEVEPDL